MNEITMNEVLRSPSERPVPVARWASRTGTLAIAIVAMGCAAAPPPEAVAAGPTTAADEAMTAVDPPASEAASYEIRMHRPASVGRRGRLIAAGEEHKKVQVRSKGQLVREQRDDAKVRFEAVERVVSIDGQGRPVESEYTIERFEMDAPGGAQVLLAPAQVLTVLRGLQTPKGEAMVDGRAVSAAVLSALENVLTMSVVSKTTDDDAFGTAQPRVPGAQWQMRGDVVARDLAETVGIRATISGATRLLKRATFQNTDCLEIAAEMSGKLLALDGLPAGATVSSGTFAAIFRGMHPIDLSMPKLSTAMRMTIHVVAELEANGQPMQVETTATKQMDESFTPL